MFQEPQVVIALAVRQANFILVPISDQTRGHGTHSVAAVWKHYLAEFMQKAEPKQ